MKLIRCDICGIIANTEAMIEIAVTFRNDSQPTIFKDLCPDCTTGLKEYFTEIPKPAV